VPYLDPTLPGIFHGSDHSARFFSTFSSSLSARVLLVGPNVDSDQAEGNDTPEGLDDPDESSFGAILDILSFLALLCIIYPLVISTPIFVVAKALSVVRILLSMNDAII